MDRWFHPEQVVSNDQWLGQFLCPCQYPKNHRSSSIIKGFVLIAEKLFPKRFNIRKLSINDS
jgi:hypothetical protein